MSKPIEKSSSMPCDKVNKSDEVLARDLVDVESNNICGELSHDYGNADPISTETTSEHNDVKTASEA